MSNVARRDVLRRLSRRAAPAWHAAIVVIAVSSALCISDLCAAHTLWQSDTPASTAQKSEILEDYWYRLLIGGKPCGWFHTLRERSGDRIVSTSETQMSIGRMGQGVTIRTRTVFTESVRGQPIKVEIQKYSSGAAINSSWLFQTDGIEITEEQEGRRSVTRHKLPAPGWLTPNAADEFVRRRLASDAKTLSYRSIDPESGPEVVDTESTRTGISEMELNGRKVSASVWTTKTSVLDRPSTETMSSDGVLLESSTDLGVGLLTSKLTTRELATAAVGAVEVMARTFIPLTTDGRKLSGARRVELLVSAKDGTLTDLPSAGSQVVTRLNAGSAKVVVNADEASVATAVEIADPRFRAATVMVDSLDPLIKSIAKKALEGCADLPLARADALRSAVYRHISHKNLASGFASASEAAKTGAGDCTEHAILLCALLRSEGIPARVVSGLLYVPEAGNIRNAYGWHMWTQAIIEGKWMDFDAVLEPRGPRFDASHLMTGSSAAEAASMDADLVRIVDLIGDTVVSVQSIDGKVFAPSAPVPPRSSGHTP